MGRAWVGKEANGPNPRHAHTHVLNCGVTALVVVREYAVSHTQGDMGGGNLEVLVAEVLLVATSGGTTLAARLVHLLHDGVHDLLCRRTTRTQPHKPKTSNEHSRGMWQPQTGAAKGCTQRDLGAGPQTQSVCFQS